MEQLVIGPFQEKWITALEQHPEEQINMVLGRKDIDGQNMRFCCLGKGLFIYNEMNNIPQVWVGGDDNYYCSFVDAQLIDEREPSKAFGYLSYSWEQLGLFSSQGTFVNDYVLFNDEFVTTTPKVTDEDKVYSSLASMNDANQTWLEIAKVMREHPEKVFSKSV